MKKQQVTILVISISNPILVGIYQNNKLYDTITQNGKTSDILPIIFQTILDKYDIQNIIYVNGPGSYMSIKVAYIFLKTLCIVKNIQLKAVSGFDFNENSPIKALGKKYFINQNGKIVVDFVNLDDIKPFKLPNNLDNIVFLDDIAPSYNLPAV
jgi:tRNA A37 threonylcarbamoyladenosine modification protein TsaB